MESEMNESTGHVATAPSAHQSLADRLLPAAVQDRQTVTSAGVEVVPVIHGVRFWRVPTHSDERGSVTELYNPAWNWHPEPLVYSYTFTIRPGIVKGWNLHKEHEDRYCILQGEMELVLYDAREDSPTFGRIGRIVLSEHDRRLVNVPRFVWHADRNIGTRDVVVVNFPTKPYDHANPDKYRLPIDTPLIPHSFPGARGW
jgi:dTDP-4-dehydrorhamnose 3,5-epimerase